MTPVCRVAGQCHHCPAPSEPCRLLAKHTAQASPSPKNSSAQVASVLQGHLASGSVSQVRLLSPRLASNFSCDYQPSQRSGGSSPGPRQHLFRLGMTLSSRLCLPAAFRPLAFASWTFLFPLRPPATLTGAVLTKVRSHWGCHVPHHRDPTGVGAFYTPGAWCPRRRRVGTAGH